MRSTRGDRQEAGGEQGWGEIVVLLLFAAVIGFAFYWALELHQKPPDKATTVNASSATTAVTLTPPTLPPPRKYKVVGGVNVRQGPGTNTTLIAALVNGNKVIVECRVAGQDVTSSAGSSNQWLRINLGQFGIGYVSAVYIDTGDDLEDSTRIAPCI